MTRNTSSQIIRQVDNKLSVCAILAAAQHFRLQLPCVLCFLYEVILSVLFVVSDILARCLNS